MCDSDAAFLTFLGSLAFCGKTAAVSLGICPHLRRRDLSCSSKTSDNSRDIDFKPSPLLQISKSSFHPSSRFRQFLSRPSDPQRTKPHSVNLDRVTAELPDTSVAEAPPTVDRAEAETPRRSAQPTSESSFPEPIYEFPPDLNRACVPDHVAIIMDGNGRWAQQRGLPRVAGHKRGVESLKATVRACAQWGIRHLTVFAFSTENSRRSSEEVGFLMALFEQVLRVEIAELVSQNVHLDFIGDLQALPTSLQRQIAHARSSSRNNSGLRLTVALNYGGRRDIVDAVRVVTQKVLSGEISPDEIDEDTISAFLSTGSGSHTHHHHPHPTQAHPTPPTGGPSSVASNSDSGSDGTRPPPQAQRHQRSGGPTSGSDSDSDLGSPTPPPSDPARPRHWSAFPTSSYVPRRQPHDPPQCPTHVHVDLPDPDLVIRTSGEMRVSNFLLWQLAYAELHVSQAYWPDFDLLELAKALRSYQHRQRRYGRLPEKDSSS